MLAVSLVLEPLTRELAMELGAEVADHCFTRAGKIRDEMTRVQVRLREKPQIVTARMAADATDPSCTLRNVRIRSLTVTKRGIEPDDKEARKGKKIAPQAGTLRMTASCLIDPAEKAHREFFCRFIGDTFMFSFEPEERDLFAEMAAEATSDAAKTDDVDTQAELGLAPPVDPAAGDVLEEQARADERKASGKRSDRDVH